MNLSTMQNLLRVDTVYLTPADRGTQVLDLTGRCAFAICTKGEFVINILNEQYNVSDHCMFACMPFVNIEVVDVGQPSEVVFGEILIEDVPMMINRWINTSNLLIIQNNPLVKISDDMFGRLLASIEEYRNEYADSKRDMHEQLCNQLQRDIIDFQSKLIIAQVLKIYFSNIPMDMKGHTHRDIVFQRFMLSLYANCREQRNVQFYAMRSGFSLKYFSTIVRQLSGATPSAWIERVVAGEAKSLLNDIHRSIKDIATMLNFTDAPTFTKYFLRVTGMTPKAYRKATQ